MMIMTQEHYVFIIQCKQEKIRRDNMLKATLHAGAAWSVSACAAAAAEVPA
jgi:hypothetical protein